MVMAIAVAFVVAALVLNLLLDGIRFLCRFLLLLSSLWLYFRRGPWVFRDMMIVSVFSVAFLFRRYDACRVVIS